MNVDSYPILKGNALFRKNELVYINKSSEEFHEYMEIMHRHDFIEIAYVISGRGRHIVRENEYGVSKGDLFIINYDVAHGFFPFEKGKDEPVVYNCVFMPEFLDASLFNHIDFQDLVSSFLFRSLFPDDFTPQPDLRLQGADFNEIGDLFGRMYSEYKLMKHGYCDMIRAYLIELIVKVFRYLGLNHKRGVLSRNRELVDKAIEYLKLNFNTDIKLEDVAMKSFISKNYFSKLFKEVAGIGFSDYIQKLRIDEACCLLRDTDSKVLDIALKTGFNDIKYFYDVFKKITGCTPGVFRKKFC